MFAAIRSHAKTTRSAIALTVAFIALVLAGGAAGYWTMCEGQPVPTDYLACVQVYGQSNCFLDVVMDISIPGNWSQRCIDNYAGIPQTQTLDDGTIIFWCRNVGTNTTGALAQGDRAIVRRRAA